MKCKICNSDLYEGQAFCSYCGTKVESDPPIQEPENEPKNRIAQNTENTQQQTESQSSDSVDTMAKTGMILGIVSLAANFTCCFSSTIPCVLGIIFSIKGLKSVKNKNMAVAGLILSIIAAAMSLITPIFSFTISGNDFNIPEFMEDFDIEIASMIHFPLFK